MAITQRASAYHRMPIAQKQALASERLAEPPVPCPADCGTQVMPADLLPHVAGRCPGPRPPGPASKWIHRSDAMRAGVPPKTLSNWARDGLIRSRGPRMDREYLYRDLVYRVAERRSGRRR